MRSLTRGEILCFALAAALLVAWTVLCLQVIGADRFSSLHQFASFWSSGWAANRGLDPYAGTYKLIPRIFVPSLLPPGVSPGLRDINLNPPALLPLFQLLALGDPARLLPVWVNLQAVLFIAAGFILLRSTQNSVPAWQILAMLLMTPMRDTIWQAQIYGLMFVSAVAGWVALKRGNAIIAGIAIGVLAAMKPNFLLWPLFLFLTGERRIAAIACMVFAALSAIPALIDGPQIYAQWLHVVRGDVHWMFTTDISLSGLIRRAGNPWLGPLLSGLLVLVSALLVQYRRPDPLRTSMTALAAGILAAPLAWGYYTMVLVPSLIDGMWGRFAIVAAGLLMLTVRVALYTMNGPPWMECLGTVVPLLPVLIVFGESLRGGQGAQPPAARQDRRSLQSTTATF